MNKRMVQQHTGRERELEIIHSQNCLKRNNAKVDTCNM